MKQNTIDWGINCYHKVKDKRKKETQVEMDNINFFSEERKIEFRVYTILISFVSIVALVNIGRYVVYLIRRK